MRQRRFPRLIAVAALLILAGGCVRGSTSSRPPIHPNPNMDNQPKYRPQAASAFFYDGATMRPPVAGTVARGELQGDLGRARGKTEDGGFLAQGPLAVDDALLARGEERFAIYCAPCHGERGDGKGPLWQRSQIASADLREERLRVMPDGQIFDTITNGLGLMAGYAYQVPTDDRWAIIAYLRQLQQAAGGGTAGGGT